MRHPREFQLGWDLDAGAAPFGRTTRLADLRKASLLADSPAPTSGTICRITSCGRVPRTRGSLQKEGATTAPVSIRGHMKSN